MNRRAFLHSGFLSPLGLSLSQSMWLQANAQASNTGGKAKACIFLYMTGGPSQHETFDPKPDAPDGIRGEYDTIATSGGRTGDASAFDEAPSLRLPAEP